MYVNKDLSPFSKAAKELVITMVKVKDPPPPTPSAICKV
jgi:hypothetical protein